MNRIQSGQNSFALALSGALIVLLAAIDLGCSGSPNEQEVVPECGTYLSALERCTQSLGPGVASRRTAAAHQVFTAAAKDEGARARLAAQCSAANEQISRACR